MANEPFRILDIDFVSRQQEIRVLHKRLMAAYIYLILTVSSPGRLPMGHEGPKQNKRPFELKENAIAKEEYDSRIRFQKEYIIRRLRIYKRRPIARNLVEAHVKRKLRELRAAYVQIEQVIPEVSTAQELRNWLKDTQDSLSRFMATLTVMAVVRRIASVLWPLIIGLAAIGAIWTYVASLSHLLVPLAIVIFLLLYYTIFVAHSAARKNGCSS
jgi:hypothetical protein